MFLHIYLIETNVSFTANSVVLIFFIYIILLLFWDRNLSFAISAIHLDDHWKWQRWDEIVGWKEAIFTNTSLQINCYLLSKNLTHSALFIPHYCQTNGHSSLCSTEWFILKTIHLYAKRHLYHKMHAIQTLTLTRWNLWSLCTMYFMLNNCCHC